MERSGVFSSAESSTRDHLAEAPPTIDYHPRAPADIHDIVLELLPAERGHILDAAAGDGYVSRAMADRGFTVTSADLHFASPAAVPRGIETDLNAQLPFDDHCFDGVVSIETIEHLENPWFFMRELSRVTKPGGFVVITSPNVQNLQSRLLMLLEGQLVWFRPRHVRPLGHITPIFEHLLDEMTQRVGLVKRRVRYSRARIPKTMNRVPVTNRWIGECRITAYSKS